MDFCAFADVYFYASAGDPSLDTLSVYGAPFATRTNFHLRCATARHRGIAGLQKRAAVLRDIVRLRDKRLVVYVTQAKALRFFSLLKAAGAPVKIMVEPHSETEPWTDDGFRHADGILFTSKDLQKRLSAKYRIPQRIPQEIIYHRIRHAGAVTPQGVPPGGHRFCLGYIGGLEAWKGVDTIVQALPNLDASVTACFIGVREMSKDHMRLMSIARDLGVAERVRCVGYVPQGELQQATAEVDAFVLPLLQSEEGSLPMKLFDYMALGKPIIAAHQNSIREIVDEDSACFFPPGSAAALSEQVKRLIAHPDLGTALSNKAYDALQSYTVDAWIAKMKVFCESL